MHKPRFEWTSKFRNQENFDAEVGRLFSKQLMTREGLESFQDVREAGMATIE